MYTYAMVAFSTGKKLYVLLKVVSMLTSFSYSAEFYGVPYTLSSDKFISCVSITKMLALLAKAHSVTQP